MERKNLNKELNELNAEIWEGKNNTKVYRRRLILMIIIFPSIATFLEYFTINANVRGNFEPFFVFLVFVAILSVALILIIEFAFLNRIRISKSEKQIQYLRDMRIYAINEFKRSQELLEVLEKQKLDEIKNEKAKVENEINLTENLSLSKQN